MADNMKSSLVIVRAYEGSGGVQVILDHGSVVECLEEAGAGTKEMVDGEEQFRPSNLGKGNALLLEVVTPKGLKGQLVWGDTHALHRSHQQDQKFFNTILEAARNNSFALTVTSAKPVAIKKANKKGGAKPALNPEAC